MDQIINALTTETTNLSSLFLLPFGLIEIYLTIHLAATILDINITNRKFTIYFLIMSFYHIIGSLFIPKPIASVLQMILIPILIGILFKPGIIKSILAEFIPLAIIVVLDSLLGKIYSAIFHLSYEQICNIPIYRVSLICIIYLVLFIVYRILKRFHINISIFDTISKPRKIELIINFVLAAFVMIFQFYLGMFYNNHLPLVIVLLNIACFIAYFVISITTFIRSAQLELTNQTLEQEKAYNKTLSALHDELRGIKHDFDNILQAIGGYISVNDMDGLKTYFPQVQKDSLRINHLSLLNPNTINDPAIYSLLTSKYFTAKEFNIDIAYFEVFVDFKELEKFIPVYQLSRILGILFDNAIEAAKESDEKIMNLHIRNEAKRNRYVICLSNSYKDKSVDTEQIYVKGVSSKGENRGLGLWEVRRFISKAKNLNLYTTKDSTYFTQQLEIYY